MKRLDLIINALENSQPITNNYEDRVEQWAIQDEALAAARELKQEKYELAEALEEAVQHFNADCKPSWEIKLRWNEALAKAKEQA